MESPKGGAMDSGCKLILAVVRPHLVETLLDGLKLAPIEALTIQEVKGFGRQKGHTELYRGAEYVIDFLPKVKIEAAIPNKLLKRAVEAIQKSALTGKIGDGKIFVMELEEVYRIRTGEAGEDAL